MRFNRAIGRASAFAAVAVCATLAACSTPERLAGGNWAGPRESPAGEEFTPEQASARGVAGWVLLRCVTGEAQASTNCFVMVETPQGWGFGAAALRASKLAQARDVTGYGGHVPSPGERFNLPFFFCPPEAMPACQTQMHTQVTAFIGQLASVQRSLSARDCKSAIAAATASGYPDFAQRVSAECPSQP